MVRRVRAYLQKLDVIDDETKLCQLSQLCEPPAGVCIRQAVTSSLDAGVIGFQFEYCRPALSELFVSFRAK